MLLVITILGLLVALAVPEFTRYKLNSQRSEMFVNLKGIAQAEIVFYNEYDKLVECSSSPGTNSDGSLRDFDPTISGWELLGWRPDGQVRCNYNVDVIDNNGVEWARPESTCDLDNDNVYASWWMDVDPENASSSSQHMKLRPSPSTEKGNRY